MNKLQYYKEEIERVNLEVQQAERDYDLNRYCCVLLCELQGQKGRRAVVWVSDMCPVLHARQSAACTRTADRCLWYVSSIAVIACAHACCFPVYNRAVCRAADLTSPVRD